MSNKYENWLAELKKTGQNGTLSGGVIRLQAEAYAEGYVERIKEFNQLKSELQALQRDVKKLKADFEAFQKGWVVEFMKQTNGEQG